jgi:hypothetical protein
MTTTKEKTQITTAVDEDTELGFGTMLIAENEGRRVPTRWDRFHHKRSARDRQPRFPEQNVGEQKRRGPVISKPLCICG